VDNVDSLFGVVRVHRQRRIVGDGVQRDEVSVAIDCAKRTSTVVLVETSLCWDAEHWADVVTIVETGCVVSDTTFQQDVVFVANVE
jgi:hypothetical protein